jgi:hypothetical protein
VTSKAWVAEPLEPIVEPIAEPEPAPEPVVEVVVEPTPEPVVEVVVEPTPEPVVEPVPEAATAADPPAKAKRKVWHRASKPVVESAPPVVEPAPPVAEPAPPVVEPEVVPTIAVPEVVPVAEVLDKPAPDEPRVVPTRDPVVEHAPVPAANWQRSNSVWTDRVFNTAPRRPENETVSWPPRWKPATPFVDLTDPDDSDADRVDSAAPAD